MKDEAIVKNPKLWNKFRVGLTTLERRENEEVKKTKASICRKGLPFLFEFKHDFLLKNSDEFTRQISDKLFLPVIKSLQSDGKYYFNSFRFGH